MKRSRLVLPILLITATVGCQPAEQETPAPATEEHESPLSPLREALTFHASFDDGPDADFARGDQRIYTAPDFDSVDSAEPGIGNPDVAILEDAGRFGACLSFSKKNTAAIFYKAQGQVAYDPDDWSGTVSFWLSLTPDEDLAPGYCDPIQITDVRYNDAAVWVDFNQDSPRRFRLGVFGDLEVWNPENFASEENPDFNNRLVVVDDPPFRRDQWTQVVITFSGLGSEWGGMARLYLNGRLQGSATEIKEPFTWDLPQAQIRIGVNYVGKFDELALFDRSLTDEEVRNLYHLDGGISTLH